jgi:FMN reductase
MTPVPRIVSLSGSLVSPSRVERLAAACARECEALGASVIEFSGPELNFPFYSPHVRERDALTQRYIDAVEDCDGIILASPTYHGSISGLLKNALDYVNDLATNDEPLLHGRPVACLAVGAGEQGTVSTMSTLRTIAHALRGWPTPLGIALTPAHAAEENDELVDEHLADQVRIVAAQVMELASAHAERVTAEELRIAT